MKVVGNANINDIDFFIFQHFAIIAVVICNTPFLREFLGISWAGNGNAKKFAQERGIANYYSDDREMLKDKEIDVVDIGIPNDLHCQVVQVFKTYQVSLENL